MFLERDGTPIVGQVPMEVRYSGGGNYSTVAADVGALVRAFVNNVRQSLVPTHCETLPLPGNGFVELRYEYGSMMVDVYLPPADDAGGPFYGGILINPHVITGDEAAYLSLAGNPTPWRVPDGVKSAGALPGRPAVPGTGDAETEWLVVQISRDLPLTGDPLATGAVRMFRIDSPLFGPFCEVAEPGRYAVSTIDGSAFFMCGRQLDHVPPMPGGLPALTRSLEAGGGPSPSRIRTVGMQPASFTYAHSVEGIIIFALVNQLWALNTRERTESTPAPWRLLAEVSMPRAYPGDYLPNEFGAEFTVTTGEDITITCSGANAVGECSGWSVTIAPGDPLPELSGTITLVDSGFRASVPHEQTANFSGSYSRPSTTVVDGWQTHTNRQHILNQPRGFPVLTTRDDYSDYGEIGGINYVAYKVLGLEESHTLTVDVLGPVPAIVPDGIVAALMPRRATRYSRAFSETGSVQGNLTTTPYRIKGYFAGNEQVLHQFDTVDFSGVLPCAVQPVFPVESSTPTTGTGSSYAPFGATVAAIGPTSWLLNVGSDSLFMTHAERFVYYRDAYLGKTSIADSHDYYGPNDAPVETTPISPTYGGYGGLYVNTKALNGRAFVYQSGHTFFYNGDPPQLAPGPPNFCYVPADDPGRNFIDRFELEFTRRDGPDYATARYFGYEGGANVSARLNFPGIQPFAPNTLIAFSWPDDLPEDVAGDDYVAGFTPPFPSLSEPGAWKGLGSAFFDGDFISRWPKRAACFSPLEQYTVTDTYVGSLLGRSFSTNKVRREGMLVANEYYAHPLPSNVSGFSDGVEPTVTNSSDRQAVAANAYDRDPYLRYVYTARDWHCGTMGWRRDAGRAGAWYIQDRPLRRFANNGERALLYETAERVEASHTLYRAGGATVMTFPDLLSFYPLRHLHGPLTPPATNIVNVAAPYLQHDLLYLDKRFPDLDVSDSIGIGGGLGSAYGVDEGDVFFYDTECLPRRPWIPGTQFVPGGPYRQGWTPNRPQLLVGYWGRDPDGGTRNPLFPVPGYWQRNPDPDAAPTAQYIFVPHITEASEAGYNLSRPEIGFTPDFTEGLFLGSPRAAEFYELQARNFLGDIGTAFDALYVDNRTGGFITQVLWSGNGGRICETYIGNRTGVVPFRPILDAWLALGGGAPADGTRVAIVRPSTAIGGPAAGPIDAQLVSLL